MSNQLYIYLDVLKYLLENKKPDFYHQETTGNMSDVLMHFTLGCMVHDAMRNTNSALLPPAGVL